MNHEVVHVVALDQAAGLDKFFRGLFHGKVRETNEHPESILYQHLCVPRRAAPRWYHEGIAVFMETWMAGGLGRAQGPYDEMVFRSMVRDSTRFYDPLGLEAEGTKVDFQVGANSYLYGTRFMSYLAYRYSPESLIQWVSRPPGSKRYFASQFRKVYGLGLGEAWRNWIQWEHGFQQANLDSIRLHRTTSYRDLTDYALGSVSRALYDPASRTIYAAVDYPGSVAFVAAIPLDGGPIRKLREVKGPAIYFVCSLAYDPDTKKLFYTTDNNDWRDLCDLDAATGKSRVLIRDARIGDLVFDRTTRALWGIRHFNGISTLVKLPYPYNDWNQVYSWPFGYDLYDIDISPDGQTLSGTLAEISGRQSLRTWRTRSLLEGDTTSTTLHDFGAAAPAGFVFSGDGKSLYGSSYYTGVSNIFRWNFDGDSMSVVTNGETGFFRPLPVARDSLVVFRFTGNGFVPALVDPKPVQDVSAVTFLGAEIAEKHPIVKRWMAPSPTTVNLESLATYAGPYREIREVGLSSMYPIVEGYKDAAALGLRLNFSDPLGFTTINLAGSYSPSRGLDPSERVHLAGDYRHRDWTFQAKWNGASFYDLVGPTKVGRKGYSVHAPAHPGSAEEFRILLHGDRIRWAGDSSGRSERRHLAGGGQAGGGRRAAELQESARLPRRGRAGARIQVESERHGEHGPLFAARPRCLEDVPDGIRRPRRRGAASREALLAVAPVGRGIFARGPQRALREFLFRRVRQQLARLPGSKAVPGLRLVSRRRAGRARGDQLHAGHARLESPAHPVPRSGESRLLRVLPPDVALRRGTPDQPGPRVGPAGGGHAGHPDGREAHGFRQPAAHAVVGIREGLPEEAAPERRVDGLPQDPVNTLL